MSDDIRLTVVICTFNRSSLLSDVLESLLEQKGAGDNYEILVVNNNSTDNTKEIIKRFENLNSNFRGVNEGNQGLSYARNRGWKEARGNYVAYIDDDALAEKNWIQEINKFIDEHDDVDGLCGPYTAFYNTRKPDWYKDDYGNWSLGSTEKELKQGEYVNGMNMVFRKEALEAVGGFDVDLGMKGAALSYGEETKLQCNIMDSGRKIYYAPKVVVKHLVADYKMKLSWMLKSTFKNGLTGPLVLDLTDIHMRTLIDAAVKGIKKFITADEKYWKNRIWVSVQRTVWLLGAWIGQRKNKNSHTNQQNYDGQDT